MALRAGYLTENQVTDLVNKGTPHRLVSTLAAAIERTCLSYSHATWTERNNTPDKQQLNDDKIHRLKHNTHRGAGVAISTDDTDNLHTTTWVQTRSDILARKRDWTLWEAGAPPQKRTKQKLTAPKPQTKDTPPARKRAHTRISATPSITRLMHQMFQTPTTDDTITAIAFRSTSPQAGALRSLQQGEHINSSVIDDTISYSLRPLLPANTAILLCTDSVLIPDATNRRNHRRIAHIINTHDITLLPLNANNHWFLAKINNVTKTVEYYNSAGTCGQDKWTHIIQPWLIRMATGPWRTLQAQSPQQPGSTECGTHLLLNVIRHIPTVDIPDTTTILWSKNMRTHLTNFLGRLGLIDEGTQAQSSDEDVEHIPRPTKRRTEHAHISVGTKRATPHTPTSLKNRHTKRTRQTHTKHHGNSGAPAPLAHALPPPPPPSPSPRTGGPAKRSRIQVSTLTQTQAAHENTQPTKRHKHTTHPPTGHIVARDCLTKALNPHWEGDRNDQCQACDAGGTLTECTRCNIVWHASCLQPPLPFPLRTQDAIVCGNACWAELTEELLTRGEPEPTQENPLHTPKLLPRRHSETTSTPHNYPSITTPTPQGDSATEPSTHDATTRGQKRKARGQRKGKRKQPRLSAHINPWTINSSQKRKQSQNTPTVDTPPTPTTSTAITAKLPP